MVIWSSVVSSILFMSGGFSFLRNMKNFLSSLLSLELMALGVGSIFLLSLKSNEMVFLAGFLVLVVCEGALGFSVLITYIRGGGNSFLKSVDVTSW